MTRGGKREGAGRPSGSYKLGNEPIAQPRGLPESMDREIPAYLEEYESLRKQKDSVVLKHSNFWEWFSHEVSERLQPPSLDIADETGSYLRLSNVVDFPDRRTIPRYPAPSAAGGGITGASDSITDEDEVEAFDLVEHIAPRPETFLVPVVGDSMEGVGIRDGSLLVVEPYRWGDPRLKNGDIVVASLGNLARVVKIFQHREKEEKTLLISANEAYEPIEITEDTPEELQIHGIVRRYIPPAFERYDTASWLPPE